MRARAHRTLWQKQLAPKLMPCSLGMCNSALVALVLLNAVCVHKQLSVREAWTPDAHNSRTMMDSVQTACTPSAAHQQVLQEPRTGSWMQIAAASHVGRLLQE